MSIGVYSGIYMLRIFHQKIKTNETENQFQKYVIYVLDHIESPSLDYKKTFQCLKKILKLVRVKVFITTPALWKTNLP